MDGEQMYVFKQHGVSVWKVLLRITLDKALLIEELMITYKYSVGEDIPLGHAQTGASQ